MLNIILKKDISFHPPEISLLHGKAEAIQFLEKTHFKMIKYSFDWRDFYVQAIVVGVKN